MLPDPTPDLKILLVSIWESLRKGINDPESRLRVPVMATADSRCNANARTVIIERVEPTTRKLYLNTDRRSPKFDEISFRPEALFVFHENEVQIRLRTRLEVHCGDEIALRSWAALPAEMRALYVTPSSPGTPVLAPTTGMPAYIDPVTSDGAAVQEGFKNYLVVGAAAICLDWLSVSPKDRRRAAFTWDSERTLKGSWLSP